MKTPREILLARHQDAESQLDRLRRRVIASELGAARAQVAQQPRNWWAIAWQELILPCRRTWATLAAVWVVIAVLKVLDGSRADSAPSARAGFSTAELRTEWHAQRQLQAELLDAAPGAAKSSPRLDPGPRSEARPAWEFLRNAATA